MLFSKTVHRICTAAVNPNNQGGIGLFTYGGKLVWNSTLPLQGYFGDAYFGIDKFGNLKDYYMYKGVGWFTQFQAIANDCDLPSFCGSSTLCSNSICRLISTTSFHFPKPQVMKRPSAFLKGPDNSRPSCIQRFGDQFN